jgi:hypothetical protein
MTTTVHDIALATHDRAPGRRLGFLWGGIGALVPTVLTLTVADYEVLGKYLAEFFAADNGPFSAAGYMARIVGLFVLGGVWAYLHHSVREPFKLVQLGMLAPAMITGLLNADNARLARDPDAGPLISLALIAPAFAQEQPGAPPSPIDEFVRGLLGRP